MDADMAAIVVKNDNRQAANCLFCNKGDKKLRNERGANKGNRGKKRIEEGIKVSMKATGSPTSQHFFYADL